MRPRKQLYGWFDPAKGYLVSRYPHDAPVRPALVYEDLATVIAMAEIKRADILWWPPLPDKVA